jgi:hypothetical protein
MFPVELYSRIFNNFYLNDWIEIRLVSKYFCNVIHSLEFEKQIILKDWRAETDLKLTNVKVVTDQVSPFFIKRLTNVKRLDLLQCHNITDDYLLHLSSLTNLRYLNLNCCREITDEGLVYLARLSKLKKIKLRCCKINGTGLVHLNESLKHLELSSSEIDNNILETISRFKKLKYLVLTHCDNITYQSFIHLKNLLQLESLNLYHSAIENIDDGLIYLQDLTKLKELNLSRCFRTTDKALVYLKQIKSLKILDISYCEGISDQSLIHLQELTNLKLLDIYYTSITFNGYNQLEWIQEVRY